MVVLDRLANIMLQNVITMPFFVSVCTNYAPEMSYFAVY